MTRLRALALLALLALLAAPAALAEVIGRATMIDGEERGVRHTRRSVRRWRLRLPCLTTLLILVHLPQHALPADPLDILAGRRTFKIHCETCHGLGGRGGIGPNLTDDFTLYGGTYQDILNVVTNGVEGKPMYAWQNRLDPEALRRVVAYVRSLKGTRPTTTEELSGTSLRVGH